MESFNSQTTYGLVPAKAGAANLGLPVDQRPPLPAPGPQTRQKITSLAVGFGMLALVGYADFTTGYQLTLLMFYLVPILLVLRFAGLGFALGMAVLSAVVWLLADLAAGHHYPEYVTPALNTTLGLAFFLLVIVLFHTRRNLQQLAQEQTESLRLENLERTRLERELLAVAEAEQRRIAHDLHDSLGQHLTATAMALKIMAQRITSNTPVDLARAGRAVDMVEDAIRLTRNLARALHPIQLEAEGLKDALQELAASLSQDLDISCQFQPANDIKLNDAKASLHLYRIAQEAVRNAIQHGQARQVVIALKVIDDSLCLAVTDNGTGLPAGASSTKGMGLRIMKYRADLLGAKLDIQNLPGGGAQIICLLPLPPNPS